MQNKNSYTPDVPEVFLRESYQVSYPVGSSATVKAVQFEKPSEDLQKTPWAAKPTTDTFVDIQDPIMPIMSSRNEFIESPIKTNILAYDEYSAKYYDHELKINELTIINLDQKKNILRLQMEIEKRDSQQQNYESTIRRQNQQLESELSTAKSYIERLLGEKEATAATVNSLTTQLEQLRDTNGKLGDQLRSEQIKYNKLEHENRSLTIKLDEFSKSIKICDAESRKIEEVQSRLSESKNQYDNLFDKYENAKAAIKKLRAENEELLEQQKNAKEIFLKTEQEYKT